MPDDKLAAEEEAGFAIAGDGCNCETCTVWITKVTISGERAALEPKDSRLATDELPASGVETETDWLGSDGTVKDGATKLVLVIEIGVRD